MSTNSFGFPQGLTSYPHDQGYSRGSTHPHRSLSQGLTQPPPHHSRGSTHPHRSHFQGLTQPPPHHSQGSTSDSYFQGHSQGSHYPQGSTYPPHSSYAPGSRQAPVPKLKQSKSLTDLFKYGGRSGGGKGKTNKSSRETEGLTDAGPDPNALPLNDLGGHLKKPSKKYFWTSRRN